MDGVRGKLDMFLDWHWLPKQFGFADGGSYSRLLDAQAPVHDLVAREVTQNSWDAAQRHRARLAAQSGSHHKPPRFRLIYDFKSVNGSEREDLLSALRIDQLRSRLSGVGHKALGFQPGATVLDSGDASEALRLLYINDYGATGLQGDPVGDEYDESDFYRAFGQIGGNDRGEGGGSFGFGKAAFIKASRIRCVIAYSSFLPTDSDSVTRRLWGFVYWKGHKRESGIAQLGQLVQDAEGLSRPLTDDAADLVAESLGFSKRNAHSPEESGTSLLIVDHVLEAETLVSSLSKYWWPALEEFQGSFDVQVRSDDRILRPKPRQDSPHLLPYLRAYEIAQDPNAQLMKHEMKPTLQKLDSGLKLGDMALVKGEPEQAEYHNDGSFAHVALIRKPRMVVEYEEFPGSTPNTTICGVFVASSEADQPLRMTEPASHNEWSPDIEESYGEGWEEARQAAAAVHERIRRHVRKFQKELRGNQTRHRDPLTVANEILASIFPDKQPRRDPGARKRKTKNRAKTKKQPGFYVSSRVDRVLRIEQPGYVSVAETWSVHIAESAPEEVTFQLHPRVWVLVDGRDTEANDRLAFSTITATCAHVQDSDSGIRCTARAGESFEVSFITQPYDENWTTKSDLRIVRSGGAGEEN